MNNDAVKGGAAAPSEAARGVVYGGLAFALWGLSAIFYKLLEHVPVLEVTAHRGLWSVPIAAAALVIMGRTRDIVPALRNPRLLAVLALSSVCVVINWLLYVWAIVADRALDASLGYFINPLVNVLLGLVLLNERLTAAQWSAVALAACGVAIQTTALGAVPWLGLSLAFTFALYGYLRKTAAIGPAQRLLVEMLLVLPVAGAYIAWLETTGRGMFAADLATAGLLAGSGLMTAVPLILFSAAARRIRLATLGLMQYLAPSMIFLTAVFIFDEPLETWGLVSFGFIWAGLVVFSVSAAREERLQRARARLPA